MRGDQSTGRTLWLLAAASVGLWLASCSGPRQRPPLPAPEYEQPTVAPWDAGRVVDPLEDDAGDWVDDEEAEEAADAGASADSGSAATPAPDAA